MNEKDKPANIPRSGLDAHQNKRADFYKKNINSFAPCAKYKKKI